MKNKKIEVRDHSFLNVWDSEEKHDKVMIFLHGLTGNYLQLQYYYQYFKNQYRILAIDFRGRGNSGQASLNSSLQEHKKDVLELIKALDLKNIVLVGYSMGGFIAALVASEIEIDKLVLLDGAATNDDHQDSIVVPTFGRLSNRYESQINYVETVVSNYSKMGISDSAELRNAVTYEVTQKEDGWYNKGNEATIRSDWSSFHQFEINTVGPKIKCPVLLIQAEGAIGALGALFQEQHYIDTKKSIQNLIVKKTPANHYTLVFERRDDVLKEMTDFL